MIAEKTQAGAVETTSADWGCLAGVNRVLFNTCVRNARACGDSGDFETALRWCSMAAWSASEKGWFGALSSRELETELLRAARQLPIPGARAAAGSKTRWLHVLSEGYATLGHTNLCRRWIGYDRESVHHVILLDQKNDVPKNLVAAAEAAGGGCLVLDPADSMLQRALELRNHAWRHADVVVLHTHPEEVMATVAFGVEGGPPVLLLNHADHVFWTGCSVADLVLDIRSSGNDWTRRFRGVNRTAALPIPLVEHGDPAGVEPVDPQGRRELREKFEIPSEATVLLTVGSASKFKTLPGLNFVSTAREIIERSNNTYLIAVGPHDEGEWRLARRDTGGRIRAVGRQPDSTLFCRSADVYLEGFPAGSLTALLEARQMGLACVRAPAESPPPFSSDGIALDSLPQPADVKSYIEAALGLIKDKTARAESGSDARKRLLLHHCGEGWLAHLSAVKSQVPREHRVYPDFISADVEKMDRDWYLRYTNASAEVPAAGEVAAAFFTEAWRRTNAKPRIDAQLWNELKQSGSPDSGQQKSPVSDAWFDRLALWRLNRAVRARGNRDRLMGIAGRAFKEGRYGVARRVVYQCGLTSPSCLVREDWLKLLVKTHIGGKLTAKWRQMKLRRTVQLTR